MVEPPKIQLNMKKDFKKLMFSNTDLCIDLKTTLISDRIAKLGKTYQGMLKHDQDYHYTFIETASERKC